MIKHLITKGHLFTWFPAMSAHNFCSKSDILKTYLEIIPPHRIYEIIEKKEHRLEDIIKKVEKNELQKKEYILGKSEVNVIAKQIKKRAYMIPVPLLTKIMEMAVREEGRKYEVQMRKVYTKIIRTMKANTESMPLEQIINFIYKLVKMNRREHELMKLVEDVIIEEKLKISYPLIRKILWSYTHLDVGTAVLYSHISKTLKIGQHEFAPLELAESAYMLSKVSENAKGGYGMFEIAANHVEVNLKRMDFHELTLASSYLFSQDLGSNAFQVKLEEEIYNKYPNKDRLKTNDLVTLLKSTSGYFFKFKENALLSIFKTSTIRMVKFSTLEQFEDIIWSWGRVGKGDKQLWHCLEQEVLRHLQQLKPRQVAFFYSALCSTHHSTEVVLRRVEDRFMEIEFQTTNQHNLIKFLLGMQKKKLYANEKFIKISQVISQQIQKLSNKEIITFLKVLNQSDIDYTNKDQLHSVIESLKKIGHILQAKLYTLKLPEIAQLLYLYIKLEIEDALLIEKCFFQLQHVIDIPKSAFIKAMFCYSMKEKYIKVLEFVPILEELLKYGPIGYFFSPYEFPLLAYCIFNLQVNGKDIKINQNLLESIKKVISEINPIMLNSFVRKGYEEARRLIQISQEMDKNKQS